MKYKKIIMKTQIVKKLKTTKNIFFNQIHKNLGL